MTKMVRVENADSGTGHKLVVQVWDKGRALPEGGVELDTMASESKLDYPTAMTEVGVHNSRYLVIKEQA